MSGVNGSLPSPAGRKATLTLSEAARTIPQTHSSVTPHPWEWPDETLSVDDPSPRPGRFLDAGRRTCPYADPPGPAERPYVHAAGRLHDRAGGRAPAGPSAHRRRLRRAGPAL